MRNERGLSLIEMFIVMSLLGLFIAAVYESVLVGLRTVNAADERERIRMELAVVLDRLTREASTARTVDRAQDARFQFDADYDASGSSTGTEDNVNYQYDGATAVLQRSNAGGGTVSVARNVTSMDFDYIDDTGTTFTSCDNTSSCGSQCCRSDVRVVLVTMTSTNDKETISVTDAVTLRNRL